MSAPLSSVAGHAALRAGAVAHRYGGVVGAVGGSLVAVGVRCDDEDHRIGESTLVRLSPGKVEAIARLPFSVFAAGGDVERPLLLDHEGRLRDKGGSVVIDDVRAIIGHAVLRNPGALHDARDGRHIASGVFAVGQDDDGYVAAVDSGLVFFTASFKERGRLALAPLGAVVAVCGGGPFIGLLVERTLVIVDRPTGHVTRAALPSEGRCIARAPRRFLIGGRAGLCARDDDDDRVRPFRPSLRAHQVTWTGPGDARSRLVVVADLFIATSEDGEDLATRDLSGYVRIAGA